MPRAEVASASRATEREGRCRPIIARRKRKRAGHVRERKARDGAHTSGRRAVAGSGYLTFAITSYSDKMIKMGIELSIHSCDNLDNFTITPNRLTGSDQIKPI